jgi:effector-binding domain-containing protein
MARISEIMLIQRTEQHALVIETVTDVNGMGRVIGESYAKIEDYLEKQGELMTDVPFVMYSDFANIDEAAVQMTIGFKVARALQGQDEIKPLLLPAQKIVVCLHRGSYPELAEIYSEMSSFIKSKGYQASGASIEYYYTGPAFPENEHVTMVEMPLNDK